MILSLLAIALVMVAFFLFGWFMHSLLTEARQSRLEAITDVLEADHDRWEDDPVPTRDRFCDTCKHEISDPREWPCNECAPGIEDHWEAE